MSDRLDIALRELARDLRTDPPSPGLADAVLGLLVDIPAPRPTPADWVRQRARWLAAGVAALFLTVVVVSPVGATVAEWFGFHGVMVDDEERDLPGAPVVPSEPSGLTLTEAARLAGFTPLVPGALGSPDGVSVSPDRRQVSLSWGSGAATIRLDQFDAGIEPLFWKSSPHTRRVQVAGVDALWFPTPHAVVVVPNGGEPETIAPRLAGPTLIWPRGDLTFRLEGGSLSTAEALVIAESVG